jgi:Spy/CpxP family protein refolding chaperone
MRSFALLACCAVLAAVACPPLASAGEGHDFGKDHARQLLADLDANAARLGISEETVAKIRGIVDDGMASAEPLRTQLGEARAALRALLSTARPDEAAVMEQARRIGTLETKLLELRLQTLLRVRPLLTDAQIEALHTVRAQRLAPLRDACRGEISASCAEAMTGRDIVHCLFAHRDHLSDACGAALSALHAEHAAP